MTSILLASLLTLTPGIYAYKSFCVQIKKRIEVVHTEARLQELKKQNYTCTNHGGQTSLCQAFLEAAGTENEISARVEQMLTPLTIEISEQLEAPSLISKGEDVEEWQVNQKIKFRNKEHLTWRLIKTTEMEKVFLGAPAEETFIIYQGLEYPITLTVKESANSRFQYFVLAKFN